MQSAANFSGASLDFFVRLGCIFGGTLDEWLVDLDACFCFFGGGRGGEAGAGDASEAGVNGCLGDDGERECSDAARRDGGLMLGALSGDTSLDASLVGLRMM